MKISIITVCLNSFKTIEQTIKSVLNQTYPDIEYIVIDGGSSDGTIDILNKYKTSISTLIIEPDNGIYEAMNKGITHSSGDIIGILNSDDWYEIDAIEQVAKCFSENRVDIVYGKTKIFDRNGYCREYGYTIDDRCNLWEKIPFMHPSMFVKRDLYDDVGLFSTRYRIASDYEFINMCWLCGKQFFYLDHTLVNFRETGISSVNRIQAIKEEQEIIIEHINNGDQLDALLKCKNEKINNAECEEKLDHNSEIVIEEIQKMNISHLILWGIGRWGRKCFDILTKNGIVIDYIVDSNSDGNEYHSYSVHKPGMLMAETNPVLVAIANLQRKDIPIEYDHGNIIMLKDLLMNKTRG